MGIWCVFTTDAFTGYLTGEARWLGVSLRSSSGWISYLGKLAGPLQLSRE